jgi:hypothetical protein
MSRDTQDPWRCQYIEVHSEPEPRLPLLGLRPLNLRGPRGHVAPINDLLRPCPKDEFYIVETPKEAYRRVLWDNPTPGLDRSKSVVGQTGHLERSSAWTHLIAALVFANYSVVRPWVIDQHSFTAQLSGLSTITIAAMFTVSLVYHVYNTVPGIASIARNADIIAIYLSIGIANVADASLLTNDFSNVPLQTAADPLITACVLVFFFATRRWFVPREETRDYQFEDSCALGLFRFQHSDLEHAGLRVAGVMTLTVSWVLSVSAAFKNLHPSVSAVWLSGVVFATVMLVSGVLFDNLLVPDNAYAKGTHVWWKCTGCNSKTLGCAMTSHAWWHVISFVGVVIMTAAREYGLSRLEWTP